VPAMHAGIRSHTVLKWARPGKSQAMILSLSNGDSASEVA